jgi:uncharacterized glyoxalase superfamily protein PhnB
MTIMSNLHVTEIKAFVPSKNFDLSKQFYKDLGFTMASEGGGVAYFHFDHVSFLLQDFCAEAFAENFMMHILVHDVDAWWNLVHESGVIEKYNVEVSGIENQPWHMRDFCLTDPSGVLWRIGQNTE